jgi:two-component system chemotaxis response regulator CheB
MSCAAIVMGTSAGGFTALRAILSKLPADFAPPILIVQHLHTSDGGLFSEHLAGVASLPVIEPCDKSTIAAGHIYVAPANYHLLVEDGATLGLSVDAPVNYSRPSIDVLFESAARIWGGGVVGVLLSGASRDGKTGLRAIKAAGGRTIAQNPVSAEEPFMPRCAIEAGVVDEVLLPPRIRERLLDLARGEHT